MIEIQNLTKTYASRAVVFDLSLSIKKGSVFGFLGPNGAGKTTTIKMLVGLSDPDSGTIAIAGQPPTELQVRESIGFMPEDPYFYDRLTGLEFLVFCGQLFKKSYHASPAHYESLLTMAGIFDARHRRIGTYSKGMKQRLGFAQALVNDPVYVFLDEPLDGLDPIGRREIKRIVRDLKNKGATVFFNSHVLADVEELCDEIGIIHKGALVYAGPVKEFCKGVPLEEQFVVAIEQVK